MSSVPLGRINVNQLESKVSYSNSSLVDLRLNGSSAIPPRSSIPFFLLFQASRQRALSIKVDTETRHDDDYTMKVMHSFFGCLATPHLFCTAREYAAVFRDRRRVGL